ncbi:SIMPL domain-containing protein [Candidatus Nomurabacteria bacterium]|nr:SIMPL domain-containing protein [Candidatus Nomurabacteria bacterium]
MEIPSQYLKNLCKALFAFLVVLSLFFAVKLLAEFRSYGMMGSSNANTITLSGHGEVTAIPDIASVYFTISKDAKTVKDAQEAVAVIEKKALDLLKAKGVADKDIKTSDASFYPKYEYREAICPPIPLGSSGSGVESSMPSPYYCPPGKQTITGYTASESITVKIRNTDDASAIMQGLGATGVSNLSGPNFAIDDEDALKAEARKKAIEDAREKAETLAKDLGVKLGRIANFSEDGGYGGPIYYAKDSMMGAGSAPAPAELPKGENTISSDVTITYEIR